MFFECFRCWYRLNQLVYLKACFNQSVNYSRKCPMILFDFINKPSGFSFSVNAVISNISK